MRVLRKTWAVLYAAVWGWVDDGAMTMAAAIAFYTTFSLAPILVLVTAIAGLAFGEAAASGALVDQLDRLVGPEPARAIESLAANAKDQERGTLAGLLGLATVLVGATTVFAELQTSLDKIWKAKPPSGSTVTWLVKVRLRGLALVGAIGFLLIVSLTFSAALAAFADWLRRAYPGMAVALGVADVILSFLVFTFLFAMIYRVLPDTRIDWGDIWLGAAVTAFLFSVGKILIGLYLGTSGIASTYGAAGSLVLVLVWVYFSSAILLFGAEITKAYSEQVGTRSRGR